MDPLGAGHRSQGIHRAHFGNHCIIRKVNINTHTHTHIYISINLLFVLYLSQTWSTNQQYEHYFGNLKIGYC